LASAGGDIKIAIKQGVSKGWVMAADVLVKSA
jgi:hypothetical protein